MRLQRRRARARAAAAGLGGERSITVSPGMRQAIRHTAADYKTGRQYGERPPMALSSALSEDVDAFIATWRPHLRPAHPYLFSKRNGAAPLAQQDVSRIFSNTCWRLAGKRTNPHLIRDMVVTHLRRTDASERELESLALFMGHSVRMQRASYDKRTMQQKVRRRRGARAGGGGRNEEARLRRRRRRRWGRRWSC